MIDVNDRWVVDVDELCYMPAKKSSARLDKKTGNTVYKKTNYFNSLSDALKFIAEVDLREDFKNSSYDLARAVAHIVDVKNEYVNLLKDLIK